MLVKLVVLILFHHSFLESLLYLSLCLLIIPLIVSTYGLQYNASLLPHHRQYYQSYHDHLLMAYDKKSLGPFLPSPYKHYYHHVGGTFRLHPQQFLLIFYKVYQHSYLNHSWHIKYDVVLVLNHRAHQEVHEQQLHSSHNQEMMYSFHRQCFYL